MITIGLGAMVGRVMGDSGAAQRIAGKLLDICGPRWVQVAMVVTAMLIGVTMFYEVAFVIIVPIAFTIVRVTGANLLWVGLPMSIALSTMHSFLPPHPGPTAVAASFDASVGLTLFYGLFFAVPFGALIALVWPRLPFVRAMNPYIPKGLVSERIFSDEEMPGMGWSLSVALLPVVLIAGAAVYDMAASETSPPCTSSPSSARHRSPCCSPCAGPVGVRPADRAGAGGGRQLMQVGGPGDGDDPAGHRGGRRLQAGPRRRRDLRLHQGHHATTGPVSPIILAWLIAAILRVALGSATVAVVTASGVVLPLLAGSGVHPEIMVLAVSCGSIAFSHVNDPGFWMFKEYFNLSVIDAIKARTTYTTVLAMLGLGGVLAVEWALDVLNL